MTVILKEVVGPTKIRLPGMKKKTRCASIVKLMMILGLLVNGLQGENKVLLGSDDGDGDVMSKDEDAAVIGGGARFFEDGVSWASALGFGGVMFV